MLFLYTEKKNKYYNKYVNEDLICFRVLYWNVWINFKAKKNAKTEI